MNSIKKFDMIEDLGLIIMSNNDILDQENIESLISGLISYPYFMYKYNRLVDIRSSVIKMTS